MTRKSIRFLVLVLVLEVANAIELPEHLKGPAKILRKTCQAEANVSEELIEKSKNGYLPDNRELQCYIECLFRTIGLYDEQGNIKFDDVSHLIPLDIKEKLDAVTAKCKTVHYRSYNYTFYTLNEISFCISNGSDKCETAWLTVKCYFEADPEHSMLP